MSKKTLCVAINIALLPPLWAVAAPYLGVTVGAVALICAAIYVASGGGARLGLQLTTGFLLGDLWAMLSLRLIALLPVSANLSLLLTLMIMGFLAVILSALFEKWTSCPAWLCGLAIGLTLLAPVGLEQAGSLPWQIAAAMLMGIWYVGFAGDLFAGWLFRLLPCSKEQ